MTWNRICLTVFLALTSAIPATAAIMSVSTIGGPSPNAAMLTIAPSHPIWSQLENALNDGGTFSFDVILNANDVDYSCTPGNFEVVSVLNSPGDLNVPPGTVGWDQDNAPLDVTFPLSGTQTFAFSYPITAGTGAANDGIKDFDTSQNWGAILFGMNTDAGCVDSLTVGIDNITIGDLTIQFDEDLEGFEAQGNTNSVEWTPVPEPHSDGMLLLMGVGMLAVLRRIL